MDEWKKQDMEALTSLMSSPGWGLLERFMKEAEEHELRELMGKKELVEVGKSLGRIDALRRVVGMPKIAVTGLRDYFDLPDIT